MSRSSAPGSRRSRGHGRGGGSLGYTRLQAYLHIVLPLAFRICLPALNNNLVNLVKTTTLAYAIGVPELLYAASQIWSEMLNVREMMNVLLVTYVAAGRHAGLCDASLGEGDAHPRLRPMRTLRITDLPVLLPSRAPRSRRPGLPRRRCSRSRRRAFGFPAVRASLGASPR